MRRGAYRREQVVYEREVEHLLDSDFGDGAVPPAYRPELLRVETLVFPVLQAECGEQVSAHHHVLESGGFGEQEDELIPILDDDLLLSAERRHGATRRFLVKRLLLPETLGFLESRNLPGRGRPPPLQRTRNQRKPKTYLIESPSSKTRCMWKT
jgi:hypothetical protein